MVKNLPHPDELISISEGFDTFHPYREETMRKRKTTWVLLFVFFLIYFSACKVDESVAPTETSIPSTETPTTKPTEDRIQTEIQSAIETATLAPFETVASSFEEIAGIWNSYYQGDPAIFRFDLDGTYELAWNKSQLDSNPIVKGKYWFEGINLHAKDNKCREGRYQVRIMNEEGEPRLLNLVKLDEPCNERGRDWRREMTEVDE
jgi:hypothetical protein